MGILCVEIGVLKATNCQSVFLQTQAQGWRYGQIPYIKNNSIRFYVTFGNIFKYFHFHPANVACQTRAPRTSYKW